MTATLAAGSALGRAASLSRSLDAERSVTLLARLERLPATRPVLWARSVVGMATFFDGYSTLAIAYAMPILAQTWHLTPATTAAIISSGYFGQLFGALFFGWLAERIGRLPVLIMTIALFGIMSVACIFSWDASSLMLFRFLQGIGTGGEVPVASAYVNELSGSRNRGRFFLLYELLFLVGLVFSGMVGYALVPRFGWQAMFIVGVIPVAVVAPLMLTLGESPRWLIGAGRLDRAERQIDRMETSARTHGQPIPPIEVDTVVPVTPATVGSLREMFGRFYGPRTALLWLLWFGAYMINNGLATWLPTLYRTVFHVPVGRAIGLGFAMTGVAACASLICALLIDRVGRRRWYAGALLFAVIPLVTLYAIGAHTAWAVFGLATLAYAAVQTVTYSLYLYSGELYPTRLRSTGAGFGSAWLRLGSMAGPWLIGTIVAGGAIGPVFLAFAGIALLTGLMCWRFAPETAGKSLEQLSP
ncbi:putative MFS transporter [Endobacter medicaginis]|uniref:MFS transporter n=1 Tax=Endobacter medicaginis TaxID=1181271 RepID=A0A839UR15_9PROT|nr:MFS transporter [Endobacter medicaginis]MBB3172618.1 putative MFS transporter [Endobacter medicaginis]MCX5476772.1 MFS transporter [Endobacter medicaginis]NVN29513.1 MFS transporter [Endobacter medicaginis]